MTARCWCRTGGPGPASPAGAGAAAGDDDLDRALDRVPVPDGPAAEVDSSTRWALIFTSGTSGGAQGGHLHASGACCVTGSRMATMLGLGPDDVGYVAMPLFHSNALMVGWAPSIVVGASVGLARRFSVSRFLPDVRRYGSTWFNYTGKPLSYLVASPPGDPTTPTTRCASPSATRAPPR